MGARMTLAAWLHDWDPIIVRLWGDFAVRWYGVAYAVGFFLAWAQLNWLAKRGASLVPRERVPDVMLAFIFGAILGGRLGYVLFYDPKLVVTWASQFPYWGVLQINKGGMAFHGALLGLFVAAVLLGRGIKQPDGTRVGKVPLPHLADLVAFVAPAGLMLGRIANFINGELLGKVAAQPGTDGPWWSVRFPQEIVHFPHTQQLPNSIEYTPDQISRLEALLSRFGAVTHGWDGARERLLDAVHHSSGPEHARLLADLAPLLTSRHPSQLYQAFVEGPIVGGLMWVLWFRPRRPGTLAYAFLIVYGVLRFVIEQYFRLPDPDVEKILGLSMGQALCVGMVAAGTLGFIATRASKRYRDVRLGGWGANAEALRA